MFYKISIKLMKKPNDKCLHKYMTVRNAFKGRDQREWIGLWKVAIDRHLVRIVVIDFHFYFNLAAILE